MITSQEVENKIQQLKNKINEYQTSNLSLNANGGKSILFVIPPEQEYDYIDKLKSMLEEEKFKIIDVNKLLIGFVDKNKESIIQKFDLLRSSISQIFKMEEKTEEKDFFKYLLKNIKESFEEKKIPVLINTGTLYGTRIENIHIMESKIIMNSVLPLVILYPAKNNRDRLMFLNSRPASKYRCVIIE